MRLFVKVLLLMILVITLGLESQHLISALSSETSDSGSCVEGRCMETRNVSNSCHCDDHCASNDDCCDDFVDVCLSNSTESCYGRCYEVSGFIVNATCSCNVECSENGTCCDDFVSVCSTNSTLELTTAPNNVTTTLISQTEANKIVNLTTALGTSPNDATTARISQTEANVTVELTTTGPSPNDVTTSGISQTEVSTTATTIVSTTTGSACQPGTTFLKIMTLFTLQMLLLIST